MDSERSADPADRDTLVLSGPITIETVDAIKPRLLQRLEIPGTCVIDAHAVTELDAEGAQLLGSFIKAVVRRADGVRWRSVSPHLLVSARALGMESWLELPES
jgi:ABC-type transporter Mla MlaB component